MRFIGMFALMGVGLSMASSRYNIRQDVAKDSPGEFELFSKYAQAAYCQRLHTGDELGTPVCTDAEGNDCVGFERAVTVTKFPNMLSPEIGGYVATNPTKGHIVVAFKGTDSWTDFETILAVDMVKVLLSSCIDCSAHNGFYTAFLSIKDKMISSVKNELAKEGQQGYRVVVTGHSLGGAVATIAGSFLRAESILCDIYTYGSPRIGNRAFMDYIESLQGFTARITNGKDFVTALPSGFSYAHIYPEYWFSGGLYGADVPQDYSAYRQLCKDSNCGSQSCAVPVVGALTFNLLSCSTKDHSGYTDNCFKPCTDPSFSKSCNKVVNRMFLELPSIEDVQNFVNDEFLRANSTMANNSTANPMLADSTTAPVDPTPAESTPAESMPAESTSADPMTPE